MIDELKNGGLEELEPSNPTLSLRRPNRRFDGGRGGGRGVHKCFYDVEDS